MVSWWYPDFRPTWGIVWTYIVKKTKQTTNKTNKILAGESEPQLFPAKKTKKAASKRAQNDACISYAEREQARPIGQT